MFSGSDSTESQNYTQWALNPSTYQNMSNEQVDWAALAQQWIIMKEAGPPLPEQIATAPPPPIISKLKKEMTEGGEAPMDVENDDEGPNQWNEGGSSDSFSWNQPVAPPPPQQPWGWNNTWSGTPPNAPPPTNVKSALLPTPSYNSFRTDNKEAPIDNSNFGYSSMPQPPGAGYWTSAGTSKVIKPHNKRYSKVNVPVPVKPAVTLDAAKRKQLPAWIREGLEKMERDKLKQMDKNRDHKHEKIEFEDKGKLRENAMELLKSAVKEVEQKRLSVYDDDSEESAASPPRRSPTPMSYEEIMLKVRRTMTEILLKVTNREIQNICREELQRHVRKLKASDQRVSAPSGANLSAKLGLGAYEGSDDSSVESDHESNHGYQDSDSELRDIIRRRKEEFSKTEKDIERRLAESEKNVTTRTSTSDSESQVDAKNQDRTSRRSEEGTPPPKSNSHNSKSSRKRQSSPSTLSDSDTDRNSKRDRRSRDKRSSSSEIRRSRTPKNKKHKSDSRNKRSRSDSRRRDSRKESRRRSRYSRSRSRSRSRSYKRRNRSRSRRRSDSYGRRSRSRSHSSRRYRRSRSHSSGRGKRSHRH